MHLLIKKNKSTCLSSDSSFFIFKIPNFHSECLKLRIYSLKLCCSILKKELSNRKELALLPVNLGFRIFFFFFYSKINEPPLPMTNILKNTIASKNLKF